MRIVPQSGPIEADIDDGMDSTGIGFKDDHAIAEVKGLFDIMGYDDDGNVVAILDAQELVLQPQPQ